MILVIVYHIQGSENLKIKKSIQKMKKIKMGCVLLFERRMPECKGSVLVEPEGIDMKLSL